MLMKMGLSKMRKAVPIRAMGDEEGGEVGKEGFHGFLIFVLSAVEGQIGYE